MNLGEAKALRRSKVEWPMDPFRWVGRAEKGNVSLPGLNLLTFFSFALSLELPGQNRQGSVFPKRLRQQKLPVSPSFQCATQPPPLLRVIQQGRRLVLCFLQDGGDLLCEYMWQGWPGLFFLKLKVLGKEENVTSPRSKSWFHL